MEESKSDGYIVWHPRHGCLYDTYAMREDYARKRWCRIYWEDYFNDEQILSGDPNLKHNAWEFAQRDGLRIRPVRLVFLDDGEKEG